MFVRDCMTANPRSVEPGIALDEAFELMRALKIRDLPVVDGRKLAGIITWTDLMSFCTAPRALRRPRFSPRLRSAQVEDIMNRNPLAVPPDTPVEVASRLIRDAKIETLAVVERQKLVGIVTQSDLFDALIHLLGGDIRGARMSVDLRGGLWDLARFAEALAGQGLDSTAVIVTARFDEMSRRGRVRVGTAAPLALADKLAAAGFDVSGLRIEPPARSTRVASEHARS